MRKKRKFIVPVAVEWELEIEAATKQDAIQEAVDRLDLMTRFGTNAGRNPLVYSAKARVKK